MSIGSTDKQLLRTTDTMDDPELNEEDKDDIINDDDDNNTHSPIAFIALILVTSLFLSAIVFQSNTTDTNTSNIIASKLTNGKNVNWPIAIATWNFIDAVEIGYDALQHTNNSIEGIIAGCSYCEYNPWDCGFSVGYGAKPDSFGEVTLDAMIMYGPTHSAGGVGGLRNIKNAIGVAHAVMLHTKHTLLVGESATKFAVMMGFEQESLATLRSKKIHKLWKENECQPNSYTNLPYSNISCPPYYYDYHDDTDNKYNGMNEYEYLGHDTIGMIAIDKSGAMSVGTSTNGLRYKIHGRVGDAAIVGHGAYVKHGVGGAVATGNGDVMMLHAPTRIAVKNMENGMSVRKACDRAMNDIVNDAYHQFEGALICMDAKGNFAASKHMNRPFHYVYKDKSLESAKILKLY